MENNLFSEHFSYHEMTYSPTAKRLGIANAPDAEAIDNLKRLCDTVLEPIRARYGKPIVITSGYRSNKLNTAIGGAKNSDHKFGAACDMRSVSDKPEENERLFKVAQTLINEGEITVRQLIDEGGGKGGYDWIHISINHSKNPQKINQILHLK